MNDQPQQWETQTAAFWRKEGLSHIIPGTGVEFHEGFNPGEVVAQLAPKGSILEVGCGYGRLSGAFDADRYTGVDINPTAVQKASELRPGHRYVAVSDSDPLPAADTAFSYAVLLHISDQDIQTFLERMTAAAPRIILAEVMDPRWRRPGDPPVFNRDPEEYILRMGMLRYGVVRYVKLPYVRYDQQPWNIGRDSRLTFLSFVRVP
jgi:SAM-dependent methyltransferase